MDIFDGPFKRPQRPRRTCTLTAVTALPTKSAPSSGSGEATKVTKKRGRSVMPAKAVAKTDVKKVRSRSVGNPTAKKATSFPPTMKAVPPSTEPTTGIETEDDDDCAIVFETPAKRGRGRPRKGAAEPPRSTATKNGKKRGRKRTRRTAEEADPIGDLVNSGKKEEAVAVTLRPGDVLLQKWGCVDTLDPFYGEEEFSRRYLVADAADDFKTDGVLRVYPPGDMDKVFEEFCFLDKMEKFTRTHLVVAALDMKLVKTPDYSFCYIVTAARPGPTLEELMEKHDELSERDATRFICGALEIIRQVNAIGYVLLDVDPANFSLDVESGCIYLRNCTNVVLSYEKFNMPEEMVRGEALRWRGGEEYAPLAYHKDPNTPMTVCDSVEALFYMFLDLCGRLPWTTETDHKDMVEKKQRWADLGEIGLAADLNPAGAMFWLNLRRGRRFVVKRTKTLANGNVILRQWRDRPNGKAIPTDSMLDWPLFFDALRIFGQWEEGVPFGLTPWDFCEQERSVEIALIGEINKARVDIRELEADIEIMERRRAEHEQHRRQMATEMRFNHEFLSTYLNNPDAEEEETIELE